MRRYIRAAAIIALTTCMAVPAFASQSPQDPAAATARRAKALKKVDKDGNGSISRDEWTRKPKAFDRIDANKDGQLTLEELQQARARHAKRVAEAG